MKNLCACHCGLRVRPKNNRGQRGGRKFVSGHNQFRKETPERFLSIHRARKGRAARVNIFEGKRPTALHRNRGEV